MSDHLVATRQSGVAKIALRRPEALNALTLDMISALDEALVDFAADRKLCALLIEGTSKAFSAGADLKELALRADGGGFASGPLSLAARLNAVLCRLEAFPVPVIASVRGWALAGGLEIVLACDLVIAGESARFGDAHANFGLLPSGGASVRLPRKVGPMRAREMMFTADVYSAVQMRDAGLVTRVVADDAVIAETEQLAAKLAARSPAGLRRMKALLRNSLEVPSATALGAEQDAWALHAKSADMQEGIYAFRERRQPRFTGE